MDKGDELQAKMDVIEWTLKNIDKFDIRDQMIVIAAMMDLGDLFEHLYAKYNGRIFFVDLGEKDDN